MGTCRARVYAATLIFKDNKDTIFLKYNDEGHIGFLRRFWHLCVCVSVCVHLCAWPFGNQSEEHNYEGSLVSICVQSLIVATRGVDASRSINSISITRGQKIQQQM